MNKHERGAAIDGEAGRLITWPVDKATWPRLVSRFSILDSQRKCQLYFIYCEWSFIIIFMIIVVWGVECGIGFTVRCTMNHEQQDPDVPHFVACCMPHPLEYLSSSWHANWSCRCNLSLGHVALALALALPLP